MSGVAPIVSALAAMQFGLETVALDADLRGSLGGDDLDVLEIVLRLEERFGFELTDDDVDRCRTVGDLAALIERKAAA